MRGDGHWTSPSDGRPAEARFEFDTDGSKTLDLVWRRWECRRFSSRGSPPLRRGDRSSISRRSTVIGVGSPVRGVTASSIASSSSTSDVPERVDAYRPCEFGASGYPCRCSPTLPEAWVGVGPSRRGGGSGLGSRRAVAGGLVRRAWVRDRLRPRPVSRPSLRVRVRGRFLRIVHDRSESSASRGRIGARVGRGIVGSGATGAPLR